MFRCAVQVFVCFFFVCLLFFLLLANNNISWIEQSSFLLTWPVVNVHSILSKNQFEPVLQEFNADMYMRQIWNESRLAFGSRDHALILQHETLDKIWLPDSYFENAIKTRVQQETRTVVLYGDGLVVFSQRYIRPMSSS